MRIYMDNCSYNRPYDDQSQMRIHLETQAKLHIQDMIRQKQIELVTLLWQREYFDKMPAGEFAVKASAYAENHPYTGMAKVL